MSGDQYFWVIGGGEMQVAVIEQARLLGLKVICSDMDPACVCSSLADVFFALDIFDVSGHVKQALHMHEAHPIVGVLAAGIDAPETMAEMAKALGHLGVHPEIARLVHNKADFRREMERLGFPVPRYKEINAGNVHDVVALAREVGYPLVVKNTDSSGSRGTRIFYSQDDLELEWIAREAIRVSPSSRALIESFWEGPEQTIETLFDVDGEFHPCFITDREFDKSQGFALETGLRHPSTLPAQTQAQMFEMARDVARALGITVGAAKFDCILTPQGPRVIEMTVRLSGGFDCQYLVPAATGKNVIRAALLTAMGQRFDPRLLQSQRDHVAISRSLWPEPGRIRRVLGLDAARAIPGVHKIVMRRRAGDVVEPYSDCTKRTCFIIASAPNMQAVEAVMSQVKATLQFDMEII